MQPGKLPDAGSARLTSRAALLWLLVLMGLLFLTACDGLTIGTPTPLAVTTATATLPAAEVTATSDVPAPRPQPTNNPTQQSTTEARAQGR